MRTSWLTVGEKSWDRLTGQPVICIGSDGQSGSARLVLAPGGVVYAADRWRFRRYRTGEKAWVGKKPAILALVYQCRLDHTTRYYGVHVASLRKDLVESGGKILANLFNSLWPDAEPLWPLACPDITVDQDWRADFPVPEDYYA